MEIGTAKDLHLTVSVDNQSEVESSSTQGEVFFSLGEFDFPFPHWNDFVATILGWWLEELRRFRLKEIDRATLLFMDGPFEVEVCRQPSGDVSLDFRERRKNGSQSTNRTTVSFDTLQGLVLDAAEQVTSSGAPARSDLDTLRNYLRAPWL